MSYRNENGNGCGYEDGKYEGKDPQDSSPRQPDLLSNTYPYNVSYPEEGLLHEEDVAQKSSLHRFLEKVFGHGVEARGIERVPEDERDGTHTIGLLLLWWSVNMVVSTVPIGVRSGARQAVTKS